MGRKSRAGVISGLFIGVSTIAIGSTAAAQMGSTSTSTGSSRIQTYQLYKSIPGIKAEAIEGIQRNSVITGGGFVNHAEVLLPEPPGLDRRNRIHDSVKHPYETVPSLQNTRLDLVH